MLDVRAVFAARPGRSTSQHLYFRLWQVLPQQDNYFYRNSGPMRRIDQKGVHTHTHKKRGVEKRQQKGVDKALDPPNIT